jgi:hypothetical protein
MKNVLPLFVWANAHGEAKIIDRILIKVLPDLLKHNCKITPEQVENSQELNIPESLYTEICVVAEELIGKRYPS